MQNKSTCQSILLHILICFNKYPEEKLESSIFKTLCNLSLKRKWTGVWKRNERQALTLNSERPLPWQR